MSITLDLTPDDEERLRHEAARHGLGATEYARRVLERELRTTRSLGEILVPFRRQVAESGLTEDEFASLVQEARDEAYQERNREVPPP